MMSENGEKHLKLLNDKISGFEAFIYPPDFAIRT